MPLTQVDFQIFEHNQLVFEDLGLTLVLLETIVERKLQKKQSPKITLFLSTILLKQAKLKTLNLTPEQWKNLRSENALDSLCQYGEALMAKNISIATLIKIQSYPGGYETIKCLYEYFDTILALGFNLVEILRMCYCRAGSLGLLRIVNFAPYLKRLNSKNPLWFSSAQITRVISSIVGHSRLGYLLLHADRLNREGFSWNSLTIIGTYPDAKEIFEKLSDENLKRLNNMGWITRDKDKNNNEIIIAPLIKILRTYDFAWMGQMTHEQPVDNKPQYVDDTNDDDDDDIFNDDALLDVVLDLHDDDKPVQNIQAHQQPTILPSFKDFIKNIPQYVPPVLNSNHNNALLPSFDEVMQHCDKQQKLSLIIANNNNHEHEHNEVCKNSNKLFIRNLW